MEENDGTLSYRAYIVLKEIEIDDFGIKVKEFPTEYTFAVFDGLEGLLGPAADFTQLTEEGIGEKMASVVGLATEAEIVKTYPKNSTTVVYRVEKLSTM